MVGEADFVVILIALYVLECLRKLLPDEFVFDRGFGSSYRIRRPILYPSNGEWGWLILNPLRPGGPVFAAKPRSYALTKLGLLAMNRANGDLTFYPRNVFGKLKVQNGSMVSFAGGTILASSTVEAHELVRVLLGMAASQEAEPDKQREDLEKRRLNIDGVATACKNLQNHALWLRYASDAMFILCFHVFPALLFFVGLTTTLRSVFPLVIFLSISSAISYRKVALLILPQTPKADLYGNIAKLLLYPLSILRCVELISYELLSSYDPVAITAVLCGKGEAAKLAGREIAVLRHSTDPLDTDDTTIEGVREYRRSRIALLESFCNENQISIPGSNPGPKAADCLTYCPSCGAQYTLKKGLCADCPNIILQPLVATDGVLDTHGRCRSRDE